MTRLVKYLIVQWAMRYTMKDVGIEIKGYFHCPCKWRCAIWLWEDNKRRFNEGNCDKTDDRLISLDQPFMADLQLLRKEGIIK